MNCIRKGCHHTGGPHTGLCKNHYAKARRAKLLAAWRIERREVG